MSISQQEFNLLIKEEKEFEQIDPLVLGPPPIEWTRQLKSKKTKDFFMLDFYRGSIELTKYTYNKRYRQTIILVRYDSSGRHTNPDGITFEGAHIHLYREGFDDKYAFPVDTLGIDISDAMDMVLTKLLKYVNVYPIPNIEIPMF